MAIKRKDGKPIRMIIARPGPYKYAHGTLHKTFDELKRAIAMTPTIKLTMGHPKKSITKRSDFLGYVKPSANEELQIIEGDVWPYKEHWHKVPEAIADKIVNGERWKTSAGFNAELIEDDIQKDMFVDHVAILREEEDPTCPLGQCGINVFQESELMTHVFVEQEQEQSDENFQENESEPEVSENPAPAVASEEPSEVAALKAEIAELRSIVAELKEPSEQKPEEPDQEVSPPVPETIIPVSNNVGLDSEHRWKRVGETVEITPKYIPKKTIHPKEDG